VSFFVDTSVWSLALRRNAPAELPEVQLLSNSLDGEAQIFTTGLVLQELLQGFAGPNARELIVERFSALPMIIPDTSDHIKAADIRNLCRRNGVQIGTIDALIAQLSIRYELKLLTTDGDFANMAQYVNLEFAL